MSAGGLGRFGPRHWARGGDQDGWCVSSCLLGGGGGTGVAEKLAVEWAVEMDVTYGEAGAGGGGEMG